MSQTSAPPKGHSSEPREVHPGLALAVIAGAQLMVVLDATIVNIALPHIQSALSFSNTDLAWVLNAYTLAFGGMLLLGGRAGDILGRRFMFVVGVLVFAAASFAGGLATSQGWLLAARVVQGVGGAIASPTALSLVTTTFAEGPARNRAFGVYAAVSGAGAAIGLLAGGVLTDFFSWRWVLFVNAPIGVLLAVVAPMVLAEGKRNSGRFDVAGALTSTLGVGGLTFGFIHAASDGWSNAVTLASFAGAVLFITIFLIIETRSAQPLMPLRLFLDRSRSGGYIVMLSVGAALFGMFYFLTQFVQEILGYSPLQAGLAFLPVSAAIVISAQVASRLADKAGPRWPLIFGCAFAAIGLLWFSRIDGGSGYLTLILPAECIMGFGLGLIFVPITLAAVAGVDQRDAGIASGMLNVTQQVGGTLGLSSLVTVSSTATQNDLQSQIARLQAQAPQGALVPKPTPAMQAEVTQHALAHGWAVGFEVGAIFVVFALLVVLFAIRVKKEDVDPEAFSLAG